MYQQQADQRNYVIFSPEETRQFGDDQPYIFHISYSDWTEGAYHLMHSHPDVMEILLLLRGKGQYSVGLHRCSVQAGDIILCNGGAVHDEFPETGQVYQTVCLGIKQLHLPHLPPHHIISPESIPVFHKPLQYHEMAYLLLAIERHAQEQSAGYQMLCQHLAMAVLELTKQMVQCVPTASIDAKNMLCAKVEEYICQHYTEELTIEKLGKEFSVSPYHLVHIFKQYTGYTLKQYILRRRIGEAQNCLIFSSDSIGQIAGQLGFQDAGYFSRLFTKYVGKSPRQYREYHKSII